MAVRSPAGHAEPSLALLRTPIGEILAIRRMTVRLGFALLSPCVRAVVFRQGWWRVDDERNHGPPTRSRAIRRYVLGRGRRPALTCSKSMRVARADRAEPHARRADHAAVYRSVCRD